MKCPKCGEEMYSSGNGGFDTERGNYVDTKYVCPKCHYEVNDTFNDLVYRAPLFQPSYSVTNYGWICPKCGAVLSPSTQECPYCTPCQITYGTTSGDISIIDNTDVTTTAQTLKKSRNENTRNHGRN